MPDELLPSPSGAHHEGEGALNEVQTESTDTDSSVQLREAFTPGQAVVTTVSIIAITCGVVLLSESAHLVGPLEVYLTGLVLLLGGIMLLPGIVLTELYRRVRGLGRSANRLQLGQHQQATVNESLLKILEELDGKITDALTEVLGAVHGQATVVQAAAEMASGEQQVVALSRHRADRG